MKVCDDGHDEIVYQEKDCPLCKTINDLSDTEYVVEDLEKAISDLQSDLDDAEEKITKLQEELDEKS